MGKECYLLCLIIMETDIEDTVSSAQVHYGVKKAYLLRNYALNL